MQFMKQLSQFETSARNQLPLLLGEALGVEPTKIHFKQSKSIGAADFVVSVAGFHFALDAQSNASTPRLLSRWQTLRSAVSGSHVPALVVPFMSTGAQEVCRQNHINWFDLSGNASVRAPGLRIRIDGQPNRFARPGRPASVFERRSVRLTRVLLTSPERDWSVREGARASGLDEGLVSRVVSRLVEDQLLLRDEKRRFRVRDRGLLLDAWREAADFTNHQIVRGQIAARSGDELTRAISSRLTKLGIEHAATGLAAAWFYDAFAMFRLATVFVTEMPSALALAEIGFREEPSANTWLVVPNDDGVFEGAREIDGLRCVHPVQAFIDLKGQPERAPEAAEHLRASSLLFGAPDGT